MSVTSLAAEATVAFDLSAPTVVVRPMLTTDRAVDLYLGDLSRRGTDRTRTTYSRILYKFADRLPVDLDVAKVKDDDCRRFLATMTHLAPGTQAHAFSVLSSFFKWLTRNEKIARNPMERLDPPRRIPSQDLDVTTVSSEDVQRLMFTASSWPERLAIGILVYLGPRRRAVARLRLSDYDRARSRIRFREKGNKTIWKPVPQALDALLESAIAAGVYGDDPAGYLVPSEGHLIRPGDRDDRVVWRLVKKVADRAGVAVHTHALRAAFAVFYLEQNPGDIEALKDLMGHRSIQTTQIYLRKRDKEAGMERVRSLDWGVAMTGNIEPDGSPQIAEEPLDSSFVVVPGDHEPPKAASSDG